MNSRDITSKHLEHFLAALAEIKDVQGLNMEHVAQKLKGLKFPDREKSLAFLAAPKGAPGLLPYQVLISVTASPNHVSRKTNVLEFKVLDTVQHSSGSISFPLFYAVFPSGRRVLGISGLELDTFGLTSTYEARSLAEDKFQVKNPQVLDVFRQLIKLFPSGDANIEACRAAALADLSSLGVVD